MQVQKDGLLYKGSLIFNALNTLFSNMDNFFDILALDKTQKKV